MGILDKLRSKFLTAYAESTGQTYASTTKRDPYVAFNYRVTIVGKHGFARAGFSEVTGLGASIEAIDYRDGDDPSLSVRKAQGLVAVEEVTFKRGISEDTDMWEWLVGSANTDDDSYKQTVIIELLNRNRKGAVTWELTGAWITNYKVGDLSGTASEIAVEEMTLTYETITRTNGTSEAQVSPTFR